MASFLVVTFVVGLAVTASGFSLFGPAKTRVVLAYGDHNYDFFTTKRTLAEALNEQGIKVYPQDKVGLALDTALTGKEVKGAIDKSLPVTIFDGYKKILGRSTSADARVILADNNIQVYAEDKLNTELILDPASTDAVGLAVKIDRAPVYYVYVDEKTIPVRTWDSIVSEVLGASKVVINLQDEINRPKNYTMLPGDTITVTRVNEIDVDQLQEIPYETQNNTSSSVPFGKSQVTQSGSNGQLKKTYHVVYKNGIEVSRRLKSAVVTKPMQKKVVTRGSISGRANFGYYSGMVTSFYKGMKGQKLLVTNLQNGKQVTVTIIGSGPFNGPLMDMGTEPFKAIGGTLSAGYLPNVSVVLLD